MTGTDLDSRRHYSTLGRRDDAALPDKLDRFLNVAIAHNALGPVVLPFIRQPQVAHAGRPISTIAGRLLVVAAASACLAAVLALATAWAEAFGWVNGILVRAATSG